MKLLPFDYLNKKPLPTDEDFVPSYRSYLCDNVLDSRELLAAIDPCIASLESQAERRLLAEYV